MRIVAGTSRWIGWSAYAVLCWIVINPAWSADGSVSPSKVLFSEPLTDGKSQARVTGGEFQADGWKSLHANDHLLYELPPWLLEGSVVFDAKGFEPGHQNHAKSCRVASLDLEW